MFLNYLPLQNFMGIAPFITASGYGLDSMENPSFVQAGKSPDLKT